MRTILLFLLLIHSGIALAQWEEIYKFPGSQGRIIELTFITAREGFVIGAPNTVYRTLDYGEHWDSIIVGTKNISAIQFINDSVGYLVTTFKNPDFLYKTLDRGKTWNPVTTNLNIPIINSMYFINDTLGFVGSSYDVYKTINGGKTWTIKQVPSGSNVAALMFPTMDRGFGTGCSSCFFMETKDQGKTWQSLPYGGYKGFEFVDSLYGFAIGGSSSFLHTQDGGDTWYTIPGPSQFNVQMSCTSRDTCYAVGAIGIFRTNNGWESWDHHGNIWPLGFRKIHCPSRDTCYATTHTNRLFRTFNGGEGGVISSLDEKEQENSNSLTIFPNPTSGLLVIEGDRFGEDYIYYIRDITGQDHLEGKGIPKEGIDVSSLVVGYYWLTLEDRAGGQHTAGFVKH